LSIFGFRYSLPFKILDAFESKKGKFAAIVCFVAHAVLSITSFFWNKRHSNTHLTGVALAKYKAMMEEQKKSIVSIKRQAEQNKAQEIKNNGLVITVALFGSKEILEAAKDTKEEALYIATQIAQNKEMEVINVTLAVQYFVSNSKLKLLGKQKRDMAGFCNPMRGHKTPYMLIHYMLNGEEKSLFIEESAVVYIK
jgi:Domain of unknown function (DUF3395)